MFTEAEKEGKQPGAESPSPVGRLLGFLAGLTQWMRGKKVWVLSVDFSLKKVADENAGGQQLEEVLGSLRKR